MSSGATCAERSVVTCRSPYRASLPVSRLLQPPRYLCICCLTSTTSRISDFRGLALGLFIQWHLPSPWSCASDGVGTGISICGVTADAISKSWSPRQCGPGSVRGLLRSLSHLFPDELGTKAQRGGGRPWVGHGARVPAQDTPSGARVLPASGRTIAGYEAARTPSSYSACPYHHPCRALRSPGVSTELSSAWSGCRLVTVFDPGLLPYPQMR